MSIVTIPREIQLLIFGQLRVLDLVRLSETCHRLKDAARDPSLWRQLTLTYERIKNKNEACRNHVSRCSSLREIVITGEEKVMRSDKIIAVLKKAKTSLTSIHLSLGLRWIFSLACLRELKTLKVSRILWGPDTNIPNGALVNLFRTLKKLEQVEMREMKFSALESLVNNNPNLHHLDIKHLSSRSLILIAEKCPQLTYIGIGDCGNVSEEALQRFADPSTTASLKELCFSKYSFYYSPQLADRLKANPPRVEIVPKYKTCRIKFFSAPL